MTRISRVSGARVWCFVLLYISRHAVTPQTARMHAGVFPAFAWAAGACHWTAQEVRGLRSLQLRIIVVRLWRRPCDQCGATARRSIRFAETWWRVTCTPTWDVAGASAWWRSAGHVARLAQRKPRRHVATTLRWRDAWRLKAVRGMLCRDTDLGRMRWQRGHCVPGCRRWDGPIQVAVGIVTETQWQGVAQNMDVYGAEYTFREQSCGARSNDYRRQDDLWCMMFDVGDTSHALRCLMFARQRDTY